MGTPGSAVRSSSHCTDPECRFNRRGIVHTCGQCSGLAKVENMCACLKAKFKVKK